MSSVLYGWCEGCQDALTGSFHGGHVHKLCFSIVWLSNVTTVLLLETSNVYSGVCK